MGKMIRRSLSAATKNSITVVDHDDLHADLRELAENDPPRYRRLVVAVRAINRLYRGEDPDAVRACVTPMLDSGDGMVS